MNPLNVILTGVPRSGTTLACHLLNGLPNTVALHEPMNVSGFSRLKNHEAICDNIDRYFADTRRSLRVSGTAISKHVQGKVPEDSFEDQRRESALRQGVTVRGAIRVEKALGADCLLVLKHPSAFTAVLESLSSRFPSYAIIRNPLAVLASWNSVAANIQAGHAPAAERLDDRLARALAQREDVTERQLYLLSWFYDTYRRVLPAESTLRYEDIVASRGKALRVISPRAHELAATLESRNNNQAYDKTLMRHLSERLLDSDGAYWHFYSRATVEALANAPER